MATVGIIANPVSARDIRRVVSNAGNLSATDRANIVLRLLTGLMAVGVDDVLIMPEKGGIRAQLGRSVDRMKRSNQRVPTINYLEMPITSTAYDSALAAKMMKAEGVSAIVVLGGDGTNRVVITHCGNIPIASLSTGTNNAFPEFREPTITGLAVGFAVTGVVPAEYALSFNKRFEVKVKDHREIAIVDVAVVSERFIGARAIWKVDNFRDLFVTFGEPAGVGMSSIVGLLEPVDRYEPIGRYVQLIPKDIASRSLHAPIVPGMIELVGYREVKTIEPGVIYRPSISAGSIALDGEREMTFDEGEDVSIRLQLDAFRTVNVSDCMNYVAQHKLLSSTHKAQEAMKNKNLG